MRWVSERGSWRVNEETGELEEQPLADHAERLRREKAQMIEDAQRQERDSWPGNRV